MKKGLQDLVWAVLPKEFKEEVKKYYRTLHEQYKEYDGLHFETAKAKVQERIVTLEYLFCGHNLTSDAEGEEILIVSRKEIQQLVEANDIVILKAAGIDNIETIQAKTVNTILNRLFGSKCLPDAAKDDAKDTKPSNVDSLEQKTSALKYQIGQTVRHRWSGEIHKIIEWCPGDHLPYRLDSGIWTKESDLEPATESDSNTAPTSCIDLDGRRLRIAAQMVPHVIGTVPLADTDNGYCKTVAVRARMLADALIAECMKGGVE